MKTRTSDLLKKLERFTNEYYKQCEKENTPPDEKGLWQYISEQKKK